MVNEESGQRTEHQPHDDPPEYTVAPRILLAEDDEEMRRLLTQSLCKAGYQVIVCPDGIDLMEHLTSYQCPGSRIDIDLILSDIRMPWVSGLEVLRGVREFVGYPPMILITAFGDDETHAQAHRLGVAAILDKPFAIEDLLGAVREIVPPS